MYILIFLLFLYTYCTYCESLNLFFDGLKNTGIVHPIRVLTEVRTRLCLCQHVWSNIAAHCQFEATAVVRVLPGLMYSASQRCCSVRRPCFQSARTRSHRGR